MYDQPIKPNGTCEVCRQPLIYDPNPNWSSIKHLFIRNPERGYWIPREHPNCDLQREKNREIEKKSQARLKKDREILQEMRELGFSQIFENKSLKPFNIDDKNRLAHDTLQRWKHPEKGILLLGLPGRGKSHLLATHGKKWMGAGLTVAFQTMTNLLALLRRGYDEDLFDERLRFVSEKVDILMLDDLGTEKRSEWAEEKLYMIINTRLNSSNLPLFVSTNLTEKQLEERYHPRIASRLKEMCTWIEVKGVDWRARDYKPNQPSYPPRPGIDEFDPY